MPSTWRIEASESTNFIADQFEEVGAIHKINYPVEVDDRWEQNLLEAIKCASVRKATGRDETFVEALKMAKLFHRLWIACVKIGQTPKGWREVQLFSLFKKGGAGTPENYKPIASCPM